MSKLRLSDPFFLLQFLVIFELGSQIYIVKSAILIFLVFLSCLERQINEAVRITSTQADFIMNSKSEFHQATTVRVLTTNAMASKQSKEKTKVGWEFCVSIQDL